MDIKGCKEVRCSMPVGGARDTDGASGLVGSESVALWGFPVLGPHQVLE